VILFLSTAFDQLYDKASDVRKVKFGCLVQICTAHYFFFLSISILFLTIFRTSLLTHFTNIYQKYQSDDRYDAVPGFLPCFTFPDSLSFKVVFGTPHCLAALFTLIQPDFATSMALNIDSSIHCFAEPSSSCHYIFYSSSVELHDDAIVKISINL